MSQGGAPRTASGAAAGSGTGGEANVKAVRAQLELMEQDCCRVAAPDYTSKFRGLEDAVDRLLPFHMYGAEDSTVAESRGNDAAVAGPGRMASSRQQEEMTLKKVAEFCTGLAALEQQVQTAETEALARSQLPLLMLQSYATAEAHALIAQEKQRKMNYEREQLEKKLAAERAVRDAQERIATAAAAQQMAAQQQQQALMMQRQLLLQQQQQQAAAAIAAKQQQEQLQQQQQQQQASVSMALPPQQQQPIQAQQQQHMGMQQPLGQQPPGMPQGQQLGVAPQAMGMPAQPPAGQPVTQQPAAPPLTAAELKAQQVAALKARFRK